MYGRASSYKNKEIAVTDCFVGEIRRINNIEARVKEAATRGFKRIFVPKYNVSAKLQSHTTIEIVGVISLMEALKIEFT